MDLLDDDIPRREVLKAAVALGGASALSACLELGNSEPAPTGDPNAKPARQHAWREYIRHDEHGNSQLPKHQTLLYINFDEASASATTSKSTRNTRHSSTSTSTGMVNCRLTPDRHSNEH